MPRPPSDAPDRILAAAAAVLAQEGPAALSVERVARQADLSKGGVLHHYRSRDAMVSALVVRALDRLDARIAARQARQDLPWARAFVAELSLDADQRGGVVLLAAIALDPGMLSPLWARRALWARRLAEGRDPGDAALIQAAVERLWLGAALGEPAPDAAARAVLRTRLEELLG
jgi:AcrR family transcriptional regulator